MTEDEKTQAGARECLKGAHQLLTLMLVSLPEPPCWNHEPLQFHTKAALEQIEVAIGWIPKANVPDI